MWELTAWFAGVFAIGDNLRTIVDRTLLSVETTCTSSSLFFLSLSDARSILKKTAIVPTQLYLLLLYTRSLTSYSASARKKAGGNAKELSSLAP
jgi:hypothetical protein